MVLHSHEPHILRYNSVPMELFMDYVPDVAAFKELNFKGADSYLCVVRPLLILYSEPRTPSHGSM